MVRPNEPPIWRTKEFRPAASASCARGMNVSAAVVSGMKRQANPTPVISSGKEPSAKKRPPMATMMAGGTWL